MNIVLGRGVDQIIFGLTEQQLIDLLGPSDKISTLYSDCRNLIYYRQKLVLKIPSHGRLGWIEVHNREATWNGVQPWAIERSVLLGMLEAHFSHPFELDDYGAMESCFGCGVELQYELGELVRFNFGVPYDEHDRDVWPIPAI